jgi:DNA-binding response OmpR family regulator
MNKRIYIVEDEVIIALEIKRSITKLGYLCVGIASNYEDALQGIAETSPDLILLDIMLKESRSGVEIAKALNNTLSAIPIIFLTSVTDERTMQAAIFTTPASYLLKPFRREELHSAILLAQHKNYLDTPLGDRLIEVGQGYSYHTAQRQLFLHNNPINLGPKERRCMDCLIQANGDIVTFDILETTIWQGERVSSSGLRTLLYRLHKKLGCKIIETIPTLGCRITLLASQVESLEVGRDL